ncbi:MAG TPA: dihydrofolate reductase [Bacilli bacterium]|nr:MAG: Dihydrofolate reductase [Tenericutes bacterium ADurb.BinA124]HNZ50217.1 dihydrofolate reductase [Bacilli bacterium]HOH18301.1 dihydrofolate reductase [Bacilli bacterium]HPX83906.1 dihydrofolate reductase [Bacilli bacterium]HQC75055.1 dihydrofolate reductase [Bacilli bacterium]
MISIIVAISQNGVIGKGKELPWNYPEDLRYFKQVTSYHTVVMGRTTFEGIVSRLHQPLPNRHNVVVSKNPNWHYPNVTVVHDYQKFLKTPHPDEVFIIGGRNIYQEALPFAKRLYITHIHRHYEGDIYFPEVDFSQFRLIKETFCDEISFCVYERIDSN